MSLAWELETLRKMIYMRLGDPEEREHFLEVINKIKRRFQKIQNAVR